MVIYSPNKYGMEDWKRIFDALDAEFGRMVYLANFRAIALRVNHDPKRFEEALHRFLPVFDGFPEKHLRVTIGTKQLMEDLTGLLLEVIPAARN